MAVVIIGLVGFLFPNSLFGLLAAIALFTLFTAALAPRWFRAATGQTYDPAVSGVHLEISDGGIVERTAMRTRTWPWTAVRQIHDGRGVVALGMAGWDMIVMPHCLWDSDKERTAFVEELRALATEMIPMKLPRGNARVDTRDLLTVGAFGAAVDVLAVIVFAMPAYRGPGEPTSNGAFVGMFAGLLVLGCVAAYLAYRLARSGLDRLHDHSPSLAIGTAHALIWAVPLYMVLGYLGLV
jgi:hypothetical protein